MATVGVGLVERRRERRVPGGGPRFQSSAVLRPGHSVTLLNISSRGALVESSTSLRPGAQTELQLLDNGTRSCIKSRIERCRVAQLDPLRYHALVLFDDCVEIGGSDEGSE